MALQGDLRSFALPDVLRLLAGTAKSGRLEVSATATTGEVWMRDGGVAGGEISSAPHAIGAADVVFELLRLPEGSFVFEEDEELAESMDAELTSVDDALAEAEALVAEWVEVETVVPSMDAWITMAEELEGDEVVVTASQWRVLATIGNGGTVADLADALELTDLAASRGVKELVEGKLAELRLDHGFAREATVDDETEEPGEVVPGQPFDPDALHREMQEDLDLLRSDERPVVMESADDALLPEPLPGAGVSYAADTIGTGHVDGRGFDAVDHPGPYEDAEPVAEAAATGEPEVAEAEVAEPAPEPWAFATPLDEMAEPAPAEAEAAPATEGDDVPFVDEIPRHDFHGKGGYRGLSSLEEELAADDPTATPEEQDTIGSTTAEQDAQAEDERGSLLKFLSTVQP